MKRFTWRHWILFSIGGLGLAGSLAVWVISGLLTNIAVTVPPSARPSFQPALLNIPSESVRFHALDGHPLAGLWIEATRAEAPTVIILHGFGASKEHMLNYLLLARKIGAAALAIDFRGHGDSAPANVSYGFYEQNDALAALALARSRRPAAPTLLWGTSMGAVTALHAAARHPDGLAGVIADAPFDTLRHTLVHHARLMFGLGEFPLLWATFPRIEARAGYRLDDVNCWTALEKITVPILFIAAENDRRMTPDLVRSLHGAYAGPKSFYVIPGTGHEFRPFEPAFQEAVTTFIQSCAPTLTTTRSSPLHRQK